MMLATQFLFLHLQVPSDYGQVAPRGQGYCFSKRIHQACLQLARYYPILHLTCDVLSCHISCSLDCSVDVICCKKFGVMPNRTA